MDIVLPDQRFLVGPHRGVENREFLQALHDRTYRERQRCQLDALGIRLALQRLAAGLHVGDIRLVILRDMRNIHPARVQARTGNFLNATQRLFFDRPELAEIDLRHFRQGRSTATGGNLS